MPTPAPKRKKQPSPALSKASNDLRKHGSGDAGLAMEERRRIKDLEKKNAALKAKVSQKSTCEPPPKTASKPKAKQQNAAPKTKAAQKSTRKPPPKTTSRPKTKRKAKSS